MSTWRLLPGAQSDMLSRLALKPVDCALHACVVWWGRQPAEDHASRIAKLEQALQDLEAKVCAGKVVAGTGGLVTLTAA
jgi:hypothetical protein